MNTPDVVSFLRATDLLGDVSDATLAAIAGQLEEREAPAGARLFEEDSVGDAAYVILEGWVALVAGGVELVRRGPGGVVGEFALIDDQPRSASGIARTRVRLLVWERRSFQHILASDPVVGRGILRVLTRKLRHDVHQGIGLRVERERWRHDLARARAVQADMLPPQAITVPGLEVAGHCASAGAVGGDFYDVLAFAEQRTGVLVADVTGSGFYSGLIVAMVKSALHAQARNDASPGPIMDVVRQTLALSREWTVMMSCAYVLLDPVARTLSYANAGHPFPLHVDARSGAVTSLEALDVILGAQETDEVRYASRQLAWRPGDTLVLYSDGITEARAHSGEMFGRARLERAVASLRGGTAAEIRDSLLARVHDHVADAAQEDDVTLVVARYPNGVKS